MLVEHPGMVCCWDEVVEKSLAAGHYATDCCWYTVDVQS